MFSPFNNNKYNDFIGLLCEILNDIIINKKTELIVEKYKYSDDSMDKINVKLIKRIRKYKKSKNNNDKIINELIKEAKQPSEDFSDSFGIKITSAITGAVMSIWNILMNAIGGWNKMKKIISGGTGFTIQGGGTIKRTFRDRYSHKKTENMPTPLESSAVKASEKMTEVGEKGKSKGDPYHAFRD